MRFLSLFVVVLFGTNLYADEKLGELSIDYILLKPRIETQEPFRVDMNIEGSQAAFRWKYQPELSAVFSIGTDSSIGRTAFIYTDEERDNFDLSLIEAYGEVIGDTGNWRLGLQPIRFGIEGGRSELETLFRRPLFYKVGVLPLRDIGLSYYIKHREFFVEFTIHNGESDSNEDGRVWVTGNWGWQASRYFKLGAMGSTGSFREEATANSSLSLAQFDKDSNSEWRMGGLFLEYEFQKWEIRMQALTGNVDQKGVESSGFNAGHLDFNYNATPYWGVLFRADTFDPDFKVGKDDTSEVSIGFKLGN